MFFIYGHGSHPGHGISTILMHFHFIVPKSLHRKCALKFSYVNVLGPRTRCDIDHIYFEIFINSSCCPHLPTFRSQAAIVSEKSTFFSSLEPKARR